MGKGRKTGKHYPQVQPSKKSLQAIKDRVTHLTTRSRTIMPLEWIVKEVNATVRGWVGYFHYRNCSKAMGHIRHHVEERLITHLRKRHKVRDRKAGYARFTYRALYERDGLYKVPATAVWKIVKVKVIDKLHNISFSFVEACLERSRALCLQSLNANFIFLAGIT